MKLSFLIAKEVYLWVPNQQHIADMPTVLEREIKKKRQNGSSTAEQHSECKKNLLPVKDALDILSGKWKIPIIIALTFEKKRFKEMQREIEGITPKMLSKELKELEINQLVKRTVYDTLPVTVEYSLTTYGKSLHKVIGELRTWGIQHRKKLLSKN